MSVKIELPPEIEANLAAQAAAQGMPFADYLRHVLEEQAGAPKGKTRSPEERAAFWRDSVKGLPDTKPLSDEAISRESIYAERG
jgi:hypothetical protein